MAGISELSDSGVLFGPRSAGTPSAQVLWLLPEPYVAISSAQPHSHHRC